VAAGTLPHPTAALHGHSKSQTVTITTSSITKVALLFPLMKAPRIKQLLKFISWWALAGMAGSAMLVSSGFLYLSP
jgi:hypothetical protein